MTWYFSEQVYSMPSLRDLPNESSPIYNGDSFMSQNNYVIPHSLDYHDSSSGRYTLESFPYLSPGSEALGYCQPQYSSTGNGQHQPYRDNPFVWIGTNNFYPSPSYEQRYLEDSYNLPQRQCYRRHHANDRTEKTNNRKRRAPTIAQRRAANIRERRRMYNLNEAFDCLRQRIPTFAYEKRLSRIETLRLAISYISFMAGIVNGEDPSTLRVNTYDPPMCQTAAAAMTQPCLRHEDSIPASQSCENDDYDEDRDDEDDDVDDVTDNDDEGECEGHGEDYDDEDECLLDANGDLQKRL